MDLGFYDVVRLLNALMATLVFGALCYRGRMYFEKYDPQQKLLYIAFTLYTLALAYASVEAYSLDIPPGLQVWPFFVANLVALYAFIRFRKSAFAKE